MSFANPARTNCLLGRETIRHNQTPWRTWLLCLQWLATLSSLWSAAAHDSITPRHTATSMRTAEFCQANSSQNWIRVLLQDELSRTKYRAGLQALACRRRDLASAESDVHWLENVRGTVLSHTTHLTQLMSHTTHVTELLSHNSSHTTQLSQLITQNSFHTTHV